MGKQRDDLTLPLIIEASESGPRRWSLVAFVPISVALLGVALILCGGLSVRDSTTTVGAAKQIDPIATGSISVSKHRHDLEMLDR